MRRFPSRVVRPLVLSLVLLSCATDRAVGPTLSPVDARSSLTTGEPIGPKVVISQVYGAGGNSGATLNRDYVELFNAGDADQSLEGWSIQYASATGTGNFGSSATQITILSGSIAAGQYVLVAEAGGTVGAPITADIADPTPIAMAAGAGKVALVNSSDPLGCNGNANLCNAAALARIVDLVGYGNANFFEGAAAPTLNATTAAFRKEHGCLDTNNNAADFTTGTPAPRNRGTTVAPCVPLEPAGPVADVAVTPAGAIVFVGGTAQFTALGTDAEGRSSPSTYTWTSSDPAILSIVRETGFATAGNQGTVTITALSANGVEGTTTASVTEPGGVGAIVVNINTPRRIPVGYTKPAFLNITGGSTNPPTVITWSTSDPNVATVDQLGYITGVGVGSATIKATAPNGVFGTNTITIVPATAPTSAIYRNHVEFGTPTDGNSGDDHLVSKPQYVVSYSTVRGAPNWVSWNLNATHFGAAPRCDCFSADQTLPADFYRVVDFDYRNSGYDRGHMVQSEPRTTTEQENAATFLLTNIVPQAGENNQGPWSKFENYLNDLARRDGKEIYVVTGGEYGPSPATLKNEGKVQIPEYTWKVAVVMNGGEGIANVTSASSMEVIAVRMPNLTTPNVPGSAVGIRDNPWEGYKTTVNAIEAAIGYDLLSALPNQLEQIVEGGHAPVAAIAPASGVEGSAIAFDGSGSSDEDGDALTYAWDFGDGSTGTGVAPSHSYAQDGSYSVTLKVTDAHGAESSVTRSVTVSNAPPVVTSIGAGNIVSGGTATVAASFTDPGAFDNPWTYRFTWSDGAVEQRTTEVRGSVSATRSFTTAGTYTVSITVTDDDGGTSASRTATFQVSRLQVGMLVSPDVINIGNNGQGQVTVTLLGTPQLDGSLIVASSARIGATAPDVKGNDDLKSSLEDVDGDGDNDLVLHFDRSLLARRGELTGTTSELTVLANLIGGGQIQATAPVSVNTR